MTEPTSSAAPVASVIRASSRRRRTLRLRRWLVNASWLPFVLLVVLVLLFGDERERGLTWLVTDALMLVWPVIVIHNVVRARPPRWGPAIHILVGVLNVSLVLLMGLGALFSESRGPSAVVVTCGAVLSLVLFVAVLVRKRHRMAITLVAALVATAAALFFTLCLATIVEGDFWRRYAPVIAVEVPVVDDEPLIAPRPSLPPPVAPTPAPVIATPPPGPGIVSPFKYGAESDCAVEVVDTARRVWLVAGREPPCDWLVNLDDKEVCADEGDDGALSIEGHPERRISLVRQGQRVERHADSMDHSRQSALLRIDGAAAVRVIVHGFCLNGDEEAEPVDDTMPVGPIGPAR